jgi:hypothetical protein
VWSVGSDRGAADIYVSEEGVAMTTAAGALWRHDGTLAASLATLAGRAHEEAGLRRLRVWLGAGLCRPVRLAPIVGARTRAERLKLAELAAVNQSGLATPCRVSIDPGRASDDTVAIVVEERVLAEIERAFRAARSRIVSIQPWWTQALSAALASHQGLRALAIREGRALTVMTGEARCFSSVQTLHPVESAESAAAAFARALVSGMISQGESLAVALDWSSWASGSADAPLGHRAVFAPWVRKLEAAA